MLSRITLKTVHYLTVDIISQASTVTCKMLSRITFKTVHYLIVDIISQTSTVSCKILLTELHLK